MASTAANVPAAILFTSGSSGGSKGVLFSAELVRPTEGAATCAPFVTLDFQPADPTFLPSLLQTMHCGGARLVCPRLDTLFADIARGAPTHIGAPPSFWEQLHRLYLSGQSPEAIRALLGRRVQVY